MKVWLLILYMTGGTPSDTRAVDNIQSEQACRQLGQQLLDDQKQMNSSGRYAFRCYAVDKAQS